MRVACVFKFSAFLQELCLNIFCDDCDRGHVEVRYRGDDKESAYEGPSFSHGCLLAGVWMADGGCRDRF